MHGKTIQSFEKVNFSTQQGLLISVVFPSIARAYQSGSSSSNLLRVLPKTAVEKQEIIKNILRCHSEYYGS